MGSPKPDSILRSVAVVLRREGVSSTLRRAFTRVFRLNRFVLLGAEVGALGEPLPLPDGAVFREVDVAELRALRAGRTDLPSDWYRDEIVRGERCFLVTVDGELAYVNWISETGASGFFTLGPGDAECAIVQCLPAFRGRRLHRLVQPWLARALARGGTRRLLYAVHDGNPAGIRPLEQGGFRRLGTGYRIATWTWSRMAPAPFTASRGAGPAVKDA